MYKGNNSNGNNNGKYGFRKPQMFSKDEFEQVIKKASYKPENMFDYLREYEKYPNKTDFFSRLKVLYDNKGIPEMTYKAVIQAIQILESDNENANK